MQFIYQLAKNIITLKEIIDGCMIWQIYIAALDSGVTGVIRISTMFGHYVMRGL
jgi:hypothetical protein